MFVLLCAMAGWLGRVVLEVRAQLALRNVFSGGGAGGGSSDDEAYPAPPLTGVRVHRAD